MLYNFPGYVLGKERIKETLRKCEIPARKVKSIADSRFRAYVAGMFRGGLQLFSQLPNINAQLARTRGCRVRLNRIQKLLMRDNLVGALDKAAE